MPESRDRLSRGTTSGSEIFPFRWGVTPLTGSGSEPLNTARRRSEITGNRLRQGRGGGGRTGLPSWYPRTPLSDISHVLEAIERRRLRLGEVEDVHNPNPSSSSSDEHVGVGGSLPKELIDSIDLLMKKLDRLKTTPSAKKAEWERKVKVLMSMR